MGTGFLQSAGPVPIFSFVRDSQTGQTGRWDSSYFFSVKALLRRIVLRLYFPFQQHPPLVYPKHNFRPKPVCVDDTVVSSTQTGLGLNSRHGRPPSRTVSSHHHTPVSSYAYFLYLRHSEYRVGMDLTQ